MNVVIAMIKIICRIAFVILAFPLNAWPQYLPPITVTGQGVYDFGFGGSGGLGGSGWNGANPFPGYQYLIAGVERYDKASSVRCSATGSSRNVTSQSDPLDKWLAAEQVYRQLKLFDSFWRFWGSSNAVDSKKMFIVYYADGYSERWMVTSPMLSMVTPGSPMPGTLKAGAGPAGVVKVDPVCG